MKMSLVEALEKLAELNDYDEILVQTNTGEPTLIDFAIDDIRNSAEDPDQTFDLKVTEDGIRELVRGVSEFPVMNGVARHVGEAPFSPEAGIGDGDSMVAADPDDGNSPLSRRGRDGRYGGVPVSFLHVPIYSPPI